MRRLLFAMLFVFGLTIMISRHETGRRSEAQTNALLSAAFSGKVEPVKEFLASGAPVNAADEVGWTALHWATARGHRRVVKLLLSRGADPNARARYGSGTENGEVVDPSKLRLEYRREKFNREMPLVDFQLTPLMIAAKTGEINIVKSLISAGADATAVDGFGYNALARAKDMARADIAEVIREAMRRRWKERTPATIPTSANGVWQMQPIPLVK